MTRNDSDDEGDSCVLIGTPLVDLLPEDAKFTNKPKRQEDQIVTDERGKQRFHGAFTGGFSAGYFNSVGTKEGWAPSTFKSTRSDRYDTKKKQRPEDFMDQEDFNEHGIAPKQLKIKSDYKEEVASKSHTGHIGFDLEDFVKPCRNTVGVKMLRKMGWREGQGVGPKIKRKLRKLKKKISNDPQRKTYGVALPGSEDSEEDNEFEDEFLVSNYDVNEFFFEVKEDLFGLGYKRLDVANMFSHDKSQSSVQESPAASLLFPMIDCKKKGNKSGMTGQAFGTGDFDDEEDAYDIYKQDALESYNFDLEGQHQKDQKKLLEKSYGFSFENDIQILKKFIHCSQTQKGPKVFNDPEIPSNFNFMHKLPNAVNIEESNDPMNNYLKSASERGDILGEQPIKPNSIFDLINPSDKQFLLDKKQQQQIKEEKAKHESNENIKINKAQRYANFIVNTKNNIQDPYGLLDTSNLTEWEKEKEKEEFKKIYEQQAMRISEAKNNNLKFISSKTLNEKNEEVDNAIKQKPIEVLESKKLTTEEEAVTNKNYGKLTRTEFDFKPHPTVCKRFNTPNPYPENVLKEYGTVKNKSGKLSSEKYSVFNFMTASSRFDSSKSVKIFDQLNTNDIENTDSSNQPTRVINLVQSESKNEKIEFETKNDSSTLKKPSIFDDHKSHVNEESTKEKEELKNNIYLQERPVEIDFFKAIFEESEEEEEENNEEQNKMDQNVSSSDESINEDSLDIKTATDAISNNSKQINSIPSSISNINLKDLNRYLSKTDDKQETNEVISTESEPAKIVFKKPGSIKNDVTTVETTGPSKFSNLIRNLVKQQSESSDSNNSSSGNSYEEISISKKKKKKSKKSKKKNKKKKKAN